MARLWIAVVGTAVYTTTDPRGTWTSTGNSLANAATANPLPIRHGPGFWTIAPQTSAYGYFFYSSTSNGAWTKKATGASTLNQGCIAVEYGGGKWVALHAGGTAEPIYTATDPSGTWFAASSSGFAGRGPAALAYIADTWIVTAVGVLGYTTNPTGSWTSATGLSANFQGYTVDYDGTTFVSSGDDNANLKQYIWYSNSLSGTWSASAGGITTNGQNSRGLAYGFASNGTGYWVHATYQGAAYYATTPSGTWTATSSVGITNITSVKYADGIWVAMGKDAGGNSIIRYTRDPTGSWSAPTSFPSLAFFPGIDVSGSGIPPTVASKTAAVSRSSL